MPIQADVMSETLLSQADVMTEPEVSQAELMTETPIRSMRQKLISTRKWSKEINDAMLVNTF